MTFGDPHLPLQWEASNILLFIHYYTRYIWIYLINELTKIYYDFAKMIQIQFSYSIKVFNDMEYMNFEFLNLSWHIPGKWQS